MKREYIRYNFKDDEHEIIKTVCDIEFNINNKQYKVSAIELVKYKDTNGKESIDYIIMSKDIYYGYIVTINPRFVKTKKSFYNYILKIW